jgi:hypothetical protein
MLVSARRNGRQEDPMLTTTTTTETATTKPRKLTLRDCWCENCGHPVMAEGVSLLPEDDYDRADRERGRCDDTACVSRAVATYAGRRLVVADLDAL